MNGLTKKENELLTKHLAEVYADIDSHELFRARVSAKRLKNIAVALLRECHNEDKNKKK